MFAFLSFFSGKREITRGGNCSGFIEGPPKAINDTIRYGTVPGDANMIPEDTAPDEDFALAITQKYQVRQILLFNRTYS